VTRVNLNGRLIEETYSCDANGIIEVEITDLNDHFSRSFKLRGKK
jgi:molecular chaperone DnaK (HSP70)